MNDPLRELLQATSRTFYRTLQVLPKSIRPQIELAYLLARTTDTIADTELVPLEQRLQALQDLRERIFGLRKVPTEFGSLARQQSISAERLLLEKCEVSVALLRMLSAEDQERVLKVLGTIIGGQEFDLRRFAGASEHYIVALQSDEELDDYTYRVAGCVGEFWTEMCIAHAFTSRQRKRLKQTTPDFEELGVRFGKGLQLTNILRDLPVDLRRGRCYLPGDKLYAALLEPGDLLKPENEPRLRPLYNSYLELAENHLAAGWKYTNAIPRGQVRVRLACAWPILIGIKTLERLRTRNVLDPRQRIKITRAEVKRIVLRSLFAYPWAPAWKGLFSAQRPAGKAVAPRAIFP